MMMNWVMALVCKTDRTYEDRSEETKLQVTRQEMANLFANDLARPTLQKRVVARTNKPRTFMAGRRPQFA